jgi:hypothetical protein
MTTPQAGVPRTNLMALLGFIGAFLVPVVGIVLGVLAQRQIAVTGEEGAGLAKAGFIIGIAGTVFQVLFFVLWFVVFFGSLTGSFVPGPR